MSHIERHIIRVTELIILAIVDCPLKNLKEFHRCLQSNSQLGHPLSQIILGQPSSISCSSID